MQPENIRKLLLASKYVEECEAFILFCWVDHKLVVIEMSDILNEEELEKYILMVAKEGNDYLRRTLKHRLEKN